jgi:hypothetical protein
MLVAGVRDMGVELREWWWRRRRGERMYHAAVDGLRVLRFLRDALVGTVAGFEEECCGPVVAFGLLRNRSERYEGL